MKLLLTGLPRSGKTTLLHDLLAELKDSFWVMANELLSADGMRIGFMAENSYGDKATIARVNAISDIMVGNYALDLTTVDSIYTKPLLQELNSGTSKWIVIDEIGRMQIKSEQFESAVKRLFTEKRSFLATIRHGDKWTNKYLARNDNINFTLSVENRTEIKDCIRVCIEAVDSYDLLSFRQVMHVCGLANKYLVDEQYVQFQKLFKNAIVYVVNKTVTKSSEHEYSVTGKHGEHALFYNLKEWHCDCDLSNGRGFYQNKKGTCSHIQACQLNSI